MPDASVPDIQLLLAGAPLTAHPYLQPFRPPYPDAFGGRIIMLHPESRGELTLASSNPAAAIRIHQNFLSTDRDWKTLRAGVRLMREIMGQPQLAPFIAHAHVPKIDDEIDAHIHISVTPRSRSTIRSAPARWGRIPTRWRWSTSTCACAESTICG
jgi:choline dehydrogenase-like flavoprotein